jgi:hypothetical protein
MSFGVLLGVFMVSLACRIYNVAWISRGEENPEAGA